MVVRENREGVGVRERDGGAGGSYQAIRFLHPHFNFHNTEPIATIFWPFSPPQLVPEGREKYDGGVSACVTQTLGSRAR